MEKTNGMFGEHGNKLKRDILDVIMYHTEDQDENYRPTIQLLCGWFNEHGFPIYLYYQFEIHRKMVHANLKAWAETEGSSDLISTLSVFSFPKGSISSASGRAEENMRWIALCNGGPNDTTVGRECDSLGKACGTLESMMKNLGASIGQIQKVEDQRTLEQGVFVKTEKEAGGAKP